MNQESLDDLFVASKTGDLERVGYWLKVGADVSASFRQLDGSERTALQYAAIGGHLEVLKLLLDHGAPVDKGRVDTGTTPLLCAAYHGYGEIMKVLLAHGAKVNVDLRKKDRDEGTPLYVASQRGYDELVRILLEHGAWVDREVEGTTPLFVAAQNGHSKVVHRLIEAGARVNWARVDGRTPLFTAAFHGHLQVIRSLIDAGADSRCNATSPSPVQWAAANGHSEVVKALLFARAPISLGVPFAASGGLGDILARMRGRLTPPWEPKEHRFVPLNIKKRIKTVWMISRKGETLLFRLPKEILMVLTDMIVQLGDTTVNVERRRVQISVSLN